MKTPPEPARAPATESQGESLAQIKRRLRSEAQGRRRRLAAEAAPRVGEHLRDVFAATLPVIKDCTVAAYWPIGDEMDVLPLTEYLRSRGCTIGLPAVERPGQPLTFRRWWAPARLIEGPYGTRHPEPDAPTLTPDWLLVPLLAFDRDGWRLGYGGGYYDRSLAGLRAKSPVRTIGIAYAGQEISRVPHDHLDQPLDLIATERHVIVAGAGGRSGQ
ncbi:5-formyltetrahydrofolate cyclo-ligase [Roseospirillum parvum]|uniref:5-formyltetrahydrofolate cyclo-ligase n=1 Tax=Roseospirillum parvum TaxID=83401 RepID=A0A1G8EU54_9PROT|nr:5-formyltetrahydrofolate cyclo-ligase [Roseospirillum parvum]SDH73418.1 5-formyltetrahydrofolate cyclo-ligase [Roseospirillum parvum]